jgi:hypothetical protein
VGDHQGGAAAPRDQRGEDHGLPRPCRQPEQRSADAAALSLLDRGDRLILVGAKLERHRRITSAG